MQKLIFFIFFAISCLLSACNQPTQVRSTAVIPSVEPQGVESVSFTLYTRAAEGGTTALGQIFMAPEGHNFLTNVSFLCRYRISPNRQSDARVKLRISAWDRDRPEPEIVWEAEESLKNSDLDSWLSFAVNHLKLAPKQRYIAWLTLLEPDVNEGDNFGVVSLGPRTFEPTSYPDGFRAFFRKDNPDGDANLMNQFPWVIEAAGQGLHFKMTFENQKL